MKIAAIYARVSSERQKEEQTIASQTAALLEYGEQEGYAIPPEWSDMSHNSEAKFRTD